MASTVKARNAATLTKNRIVLSSLSKDSMIRRIDSMRPAIHKGSHTVNSPCAANQTASKPVVYPASKRDYYDRGYDNRYNY